MSLQMKRRKKFLFTVHNNVNAQFNFMKHLDLRLLVNSMKFKENYKKITLYSSTAKKHQDSLQAKQITNTTKNFPPLLLTKDANDRLISPPLPPPIRQFSIRNFSEVRRRFM